MNLQRIGGLAAITEAVIYVLAFIIFGAVVEYLPAGASATERLAYLAENQLLLTTTNLVIYVLFGIVLSALVLAIYDRTKAEPTTSRLAAVFGFIWVALVIASGMTANVGLSAVIQNGASSPEDAIILWKMVNVVVESLGGGNEIVGGVWLILLSIAGLKSTSLPRSLVGYGILVGTLGICTIYPAGIFTELFGTTQIIWFVWIGVVMLKR